MKLKVLECFKEEVVEFRRDISEVSKTHARQSHQLEGLDDKVDKMQRQVDANSHSAITQGVKQDELERRMVAHNARLDAKIDNQYTILGNRVENLDNKIGVFKDDILAKIEKDRASDKITDNAFKTKVFEKLDQNSTQINKNKGRDDMLKLLFGGSVIGLLVKALMGV